MKRIHIDTIVSSTDKISFGTQEPRRTPYTLEYKGHDFTVTDIFLTVNWKMGGHYGNECMEATVTIEDITIEYIDDNDNTSEVILNDSDLCRLAEHLTQSFDWEQLEN